MGGKDVVEHGEKNGGVCVTGPGAGALATAAMAAWAGATAFWFGIGAMIWRLFFEPRIKDLQRQLTAERERCDREIEDLRDRIKSLEAVWMFQTPQHLRAQVQGALSEQHAELDSLRREKER